MIKKQLLPLNKWYQSQLRKAIDPDTNRVISQELFTNIYEFYVMKRSEYRDDYIKNWTEEYRNYYKNKNNQEIEEEKVEA